MLIFRAWATYGCTTRTNRTTCQGPLSRLCDRVVSIGQPQGNGESLYKIAIFSKSRSPWQKPKKLGGKARTRRRGWGGARAPLGTLKMSFLFFRFFLNEKRQKYWNLRDGPFHFWGGWGCSITEKILHQRSKRKKIVHREAPVGCFIDQFREWY